MYITKQFRLKHLTPKNPTCRLGKARGRGNYMMAYWRQKKSITKYLVFYPSKPLGGKLFSNFLLLTPVCHEPMSQKEKISQQLKLFVIFSSTQHNDVKREIANNYLPLSQVHNLLARKVKLPETSEYMWVRKHQTNWRIKTFENDLTPFSAFQAKGDGEGGGGRK